MSIRFFSVTKDTTEASVIKLHAKLNNNDMLCHYQKQCSFLQCQGLSQGSEVKYVSDLTRTGVVNFIELHITVNMIKWYPFFANIRTPCQGQGYNHGS